ncbi:MAG: Rrf2 family transcriptional regulator [Planctomycetota bacterium]|nr:Rrf2 family transcriptional regulator [Planctomycetota bacterium]
MLQLTKRTEYGLIALVHMADHEGRVVSVREIGEHYPVPRRLMAEVLKDLAHAGIVESQRGATGGYMLARSADLITLAEIVTTLEGEPLITNCEGHADKLAHESCDIAPTCRIRSPLQRIREGIHGLMERTTLRSLSRPSIPVPLRAPSATHESGGDVLTA